MNFFAASASRPIASCTAALSDHARHQSSHLETLAVTSSKSVSATPLATKRGPQWAIADLTISSMLMRELLRRLCLRLRRLLRPVVRLRLGALEFFLGLEARRHRGVGAGEHLMMLNVQRAQPALLTHRERDEVADLDQFGLT